jgi:putative inorganic carbon (HCO3(-)) transporter
LKNYNPPIEEFYFLKVKNMWRYFKGQHFSFWMICFYLFFEYSRPQAIFPSIDFLPWAQLFLIGALIGAITDPTVKWVRHPINFFIFLFAVANFLSMLFAYIPEIALKNPMDVFGWFIIYFLIINIVNTEQRLYVFLFVFLVCAAKIAIGTSRIFAFRGFSFTTWGLTGPPGFFQNSGELSILMLTLFPLAYFLYNHLKNRVGRIEKLILIVFWIAPIVTILGASSRGGQLALAVQLFFIFRRKIYKFRNLVLIVLFITSLFYLLPEEQKLRFQSSGDDRTSQQRLLYWEHGIEMIGDYPWFGLGYGNFPYYYAEHYPEDMLYSSAQVSHNILIQVGVGVGFIGFLPFFALLIIPFWKGRKLVKEIGDNSFYCVAMKGVVYGHLGFVIAGQFVTVAYYPFLWIGLAFFVIINNNFVKANRSENGSFKIATFEPRK